MKVVCGIVAGVILTSALASAQTNYHFFPRRPAHVTLLKDYGVLISYGSGNDTAGLAIKRPNGKRVQFFMAFPTIVNGRHFNVYGCAHDQDCAPPGIEFGKTPIRVTYWIQKAPWGENVKVSDTIDKS